MLTQSFMKVLNKSLGSASFDISQLAGDGSQRTYYRLNFPVPLLARFQGSEKEEEITDLVLMVLNASNDKEKLALGSYPWIFVQSNIKEAVNVPKIFSVLKEEGLILMEDLGDQSFKDVALDLLSTQDLEALQTLFQRAIQCIANLWELPEHSQANWPHVPFDGVFFLRELIFFKQHFLENYANLPLKASEKRILEDEFFSLSHYLAKRKFRLCHRDFHSRNLMITRSSELFVIDFQDARQGPLAYDLISLCFDSYLPLPQSLRLDLLGKGVRDLSLTLDAQERDDLVQSWPVCLLQRQLKALGSFAYLELAQKKGSYLQNVPKALATLEDIRDARWPFISDLSALLQEKLQGTNLSAGAL